MKKFVDVESPYGNNDKEIIKRNIRYARACVRDCLSRGEYPYASHLFFTQTGIFDDNKPEERIRGIEAGKEIIGRLGAITVVYEDLGISEGMKKGIELALSEGRKVEYRRLGDNWEEEYLEHVKNHSHNGVW